MAQPDVLDGYAEAAAELIPAYEALRTLDVLQCVAALLPVAPSNILDVGAGTGRDAAFFAAQGHCVVAVEAVRALREAGMALHSDDKIRWLDDQLPTLARVRQEAVQYELTLAIGVWQHLPAQDHRQAMTALAATVASHGRLIISLRDGPGSPTRPCFPADPDRIAGYAAESGLRLRVRRTAASLQQVNRDLGVTWTWLCFERC